MPSAFPLPLMALLPLQIIYEKMSLATIFYMSLCSQKVRYSLRRVRFDVQSMLFSLYENYIGITVGLPNDLPNLHVGIELSPICFEKCSRNGFVQTIENIPVGFTFNRISEDLDTMDFSSDVSTDAYVWCRNEKERLDIYKHLAAFFFNACRTDKCEIDRHNGPIEYLFAAATISNRKFSKISSSSGFMEPSGLNGDEMQLLLENANAKKLSLHEEFPAGWQYHGPFKNKEICVSGRWVTVDSVLNMESENVDLRETSITREEITMILKKWQSGGLKNLKKLSMCTWISNVNIDWRAIIRECGLTDWPVPFNAHEFGARWSGVIQNKDGVWANLAGTMDSLEFRR